MLFYRQMTCMQLHLVNDRNMYGCEVCYIPNVKNTTVSISNFDAAIIKDEHMLLEMDFGTCVCSDYIHLPSDNI